MDKIKAFLTQKINKDSFKDVDVKRSIKLTICGALIIALMIQAIGCFCAPLNVSAVEDNSLVGTWVLNDTVSFLSTTTNVYLDGFMYGRTSQTDSTLIKVDLKFLQITNDRVVFSSVSTLSSSYYPYYSNDYLVSTGWRTSYQNYGAGTYYPSDDILARTIVILTEPTDEFFITWLPANAKKQVSQVYDFTGETRIFNDELTLFNTSEATWNDAWGFNFEVLGVGTADYLHLSRDTRNWYTMSYSFDFEGSGGLTMIYRDTPPLDDGNGEWLGGKVNRKVITFLSNPDDPEFQQWLLDNTELYDDVDAAYQIGFNSGYNNGYEEGFSNKLIGDTLKGPIDALSALTIIEVQGVAITLGGVVMTAIALCLVLAFLKLYAGG